MHVLQSIRGLTHPCANFQNHSRVRCLSVFVREECHVAMGRNANSPIIFVAARRFSFHHRYFQHETRSAIGLQQVCLEPTIHYRKVAVSHVMSCISTLLCLVDHVCVAVYPPTDKVTHLHISRANKCALSIRTVREECHTHDPDTNCGYCLSAISGRSP
jgi:hypothetical protein